MFMALIDGYKSSCFDGLGVRVAYALMGGCMSKL